MDNCRRLAGEHGFVPVFDQNKNYIWTPVQVLEFIEEIQKFKVKLMSNGGEKYVNRLSLRFKIEDPVRFQERVEITKKRQRNAEDELRFIKYINSIQDSFSNPMPKNIKQKIIKFANIKKHEALSAAIQLLSTELMQQVEKEYVMFMKKCYVLKKMEDPANDQEWSRLRIRNRFEIHRRQYFGLIEQYEFGFQDVYEYLAKVHYCHIFKVVETLNVITKRT